MNEAAIREAAIKYPSYAQPPYDGLMQALGFDGVYLFVKEFGGGSVYVPSLSVIFRDCIIQDFLHGGYRGAGGLRFYVRKYGCSENFLRRVWQTRSRG